jgi:hypothetical protein
MLVSLGEKRMKKTEQRLRDLWDVIIYSKICIMGVLRGEKETMCKEIMAENFPNFIKKLISPSKRLFKKSK